MKWISHRFSVVQGYQEQQPLPSEDEITVSCTVNPQRPECEDSAHAPSTGIMHEGQGR